MSENHFSLCSMIPAVQLGLNYYIFTSDKQWKALMISSSSSHLACLPYLFSIILWKLLHNLFFYPFAGIVFVCLDNVLFGNNWCFFTVFWLPHRCSFSFFPFGAQKCPKKSYLYYKKFFQEWANRIDGQLVKTVHCLFEIKSLENKWLSRNTFAETVSHTWC